MCRKNVSQLASSAVGFIVLTRRTVRSGKSISADAFSIETLAAAVAVIWAGSGHFVSQNERNVHLMPAEVVVVDGDKPATGFHRLDERSVVRDGNGRWSAD